MRYGSDHCGYSMPRAVSENQFTGTFVGDAGTHLRLEESFVTGHIENKSYSETYKGAVRYDINAATFNTLATVAGLLAAAILEGCPPQSGCIQGP